MSTRYIRTGLKPTTYEITEPVTVDLREHVRQYQLNLGKPGKKLELQMWIRGHKKGQHYGPQE